MLPYPLSNFEKQKYYQNEPIFNGVYSRDNLAEHSSSEMKDGTYVINVDDYSDIKTHWVSLYVLNNDVTYIDSFGVEHILKKIKIFIKNKKMKTNIFRLQGYDSIMCGYFRIGFLLAGKTLTYITNLFSPNNFKKMMI